MDDKIAPDPARDAFERAAALENRATVFLKDLTRSKKIRHELIAAGYNQKPYALIPMPKDILKINAFTTFCAELRVLHPEIKEIRLLPPAVGPTYNNGDPAYKKSARLSLWLRKPTLLDRLLSPDKNER